MSVNVEGLESQVSKQDFQNLIVKCDFAVFVETWLGKNKNITLNGFHVVSKEPKLKIGKTGRISGGIMFACKNKYRNFVRVLDNKMDDVLWIGVSKNVLDNIDLCLGIVYNPPQNSAYRDAYFFDKLAEEVAEINALYEGATVLLMGDFNARIGDWQRKRGKGGLFGRRSKDDVVNSNGLQLINFC